MTSNIIALVWVVCGSRGFMQYLIIRCQLKAQITLERERNRAFTDYVNRFPHAAELLDCEDERGRRSLWIRNDRQPGRTAPSTGSALPSLESFPAAGKSAHAVDNRQVKLTS